MLSSYLPILILAALGLLFAVGSLGVSSLLRPNKPNPVKLSPYECGIVPERTPQGERFPVKFYLVAMLFIVFDVETIFLFPWAVTFRRLGLFGLVEMGIFIGLVFVAYVYVWRKGGLDWSSPAVDRALSLGAQPEIGIRPAPTATGTETSDPSKEVAGAR
jgi:NADH-quinone oxidoreductase subunit A